MAVVLRCWWPSRLATSLKLAPLLINRLAAVWRSIWAPLSRPSGIPARFRLRLTMRVTAVGSKRTFKRFLAPLRHIEWVVYCKAPFAGPQQVLRYLSRYTHRVAISNRRLVAA